jgi:hypothetical protein
MSEVDHNKTEVIPKPRAFFQRGEGSPKMHREGRSFAPPEERLRSG